MADDLPETMTNFINRLEDKHNAHKWIDSMPENCTIIMIGDYEDKELGPVQSYATFGDMEIRDLFWLLHQVLDMVKYGELSFEEFDCDPE